MNIPGVLIFWWFGLFRLRQLALTDLVSTELAQLNTNFDKEIDSFQYFLVSFGASWCPFSNLLLPVLAHTALHNPHKNVGIGYVDCTVAQAVCSRYNIVKYPTIKFFANGFPRKSEYRNPRDARQFLQFINREIQPAVFKHTDPSELASLAASGPKKALIGTFSAGNKDIKSKFYDLAESFRDLCEFHWFEAPEVSFTFKIRGTTISFEGELENIEGFIKKNCQPAIDELTYENSAQYVEEGKPLLVLFALINDTTTIEFYKRAVDHMIPHEKKRVKFLYADATQFLEQLSVLRIGLEDLPVLVIDSYRHLYKFDRPLEDLEIPGVFQKFVSDIFNSQHHERFHRGNPIAHRCAWRQTSNCNHAGVRIPFHDKTCRETVQPSDSGFCECGHGIVLGFDCEESRAPFICEVKCSEAQETKPDLSSCSWRQTGNCDPNGPREPELDSDCLTLIVRGRSGVCDCGVDGIKINFTCEHETVTCEEECVKAIKSVMATFLEVEKSEKGAFKKTWSIFSVFRPAESSYSLKRDEL
jgi:endoplasmic reticulum resident protein 44